MTWYFDPKFLATNVTLAVIFGLAIWQFLSSEEKRQGVARTNAEELGRLYASKIVMQARVSVSSTWSLDAYLKVDSCNVTTSNFDAIAAGIIENYRGISNLQLAPEGTVSQIYPLVNEKQDNRGAIGHALMVDPNRRGGAVSTILKQSTTFIGPVTLIQGGLAVLARHPVFTTHASKYLPSQSWSNEDGESYSTNCSTPESRLADCHFPGPLTRKGEPTYFWGFVTMLALMSDFLETADLAGLEEQGFQYQLVTAAADDPLLIVHSSRASAIDNLGNPVEVEVLVPRLGIDWRLLLEPTGGWQPVSNEFWLQLVLLVCLTFVTGLGVSFLMVGNVRSTYQRRKQLEEEREHRLNLQVLEGRDCLRNMAHPMNVISASDFLSLSAEDLFSLHEGVRDLHRLVVLDTLADVMDFFSLDSERKAVIFSYQWLSWTKKGPNETQLQAMHSALHFYCKAHSISFDDVYVWLDILAIPQCNREMQQLAVYSLYIYASKVHALIIIAPESTHENTGQKADLETYKSRVWTRVEQVANLISNSKDVIFIWSPEGLSQVGDAWIQDIIGIFDAEMTCCRLKHVNQRICDKASLVKPLLGMWYQVKMGMKLGTATPGAKTFSELAETQKSRIFPSHFDFITETGVESKELFSDLVDRIEKLALEDDGKYEENIDTSSTLQKRKTFNRMKASQPVKFCDELPKSQPMSPSDQTENEGMIRERF
eukprot:TRINITY_DN12612_c1_g1_i1.p1 TRINITY_DN12612_c1_g1~~TRINITY_DN12612_c1_g1_i1.p1  ORF type:complete len:712 (-),score=115.65 TRINITY_DN12612_c1_g1_i1:185-2320(-)